MFPWDRVRAIYYNLVLNELTDLTFHELIQVAHPYSNDVIGITSHIFGDSSILCDFIEERISHEFGRTQFYAALADLFQGFSVYNYSFSFTPQSVDSDTFEVVKAVVAVLAYFSFESTHSLAFNFFAKATTTDSRFEFTIRSCYCLKNFFSLSAIEQELDLPIIAQRNTIIILCGPSDQTVVERRLRRDNSICRIDRVPQGLKVQLAYYSYKVPGVCFYECYERADSSW